MGFGRLDFTDQTITKLVVTGSGATKPTSYTYQRCKLLKDSVVNPEMACCSIVYFSSLNVGAQGSTILGFRNSYIQINHTKDHRDLGRRDSLYKESKIEITQAIINAYKIYFHAFDDCTFTIGSWSGKLEGTTEDEYRDFFFQKCIAEGVVIVESDLNNWVFANGSSAEGKIFKDSIIANFADRKSIKLGAFDYYIEPIVITKSGINIPNSIGSIKGEKIDATEHALYLDSNFPITHKATGSISSKVISLKEIQKLSSIDVLSNFPTGIGLGVTSEHAIKGEGVLVKDINDKKKTLEVGQRYIVRASHEGEGAIQYASFVYNNGNYNTNLATRYNILIATDSNEFTSVVGDPILYPVPNPELYQTYEIRIVDDIPPTIYGKGQTLAAGYWYIVEPKDGIENGSAKCGGIDYPTYCSFYVESNILVEELKDAVVRRCFSEEYSKEQDPFYNDTDGKSKQKPIWFSVVGNDMRGLRKGNSIYEDEMQFDAASQKYIGSGYPDFYSLINGHTGIRLPSFPIKGKYFQLRVKVSSFNIM